MSSLTECLREMEAAVLEAGFWLDKGNPEKAAAAATWAVRYGRVVLEENERARLAMEGKW